MIKSLFDEAEETTQDEIKKINQPAIPVKHTFLPDENNLLEVLPAYDAESSNLIEMRPVEDFEDKQTSVNVPNAENTAPETNNAEPIINFTLSNPFEPTNETQKKETDEPMLFQMQNKPESTAETARKSGLAMSAAIALFGSVVFLLIVGWFADLLLGTSPWGIVGGIVLGSIIGFFQFFRMTSQILKNKD